MIEKVVILSTSTMGEREPFLERGSITESVFHDADSARRGLLFADLFYGFCVTRRWLAIRQADSSRHSSESVCCFQEEGQCQGAQLLSESVRWVA